MFGNADSAVLAVGSSALPDYRESGGSVFVGFFGCFWFGVSGWRVPFLFVH